MPPPRSENDLKRLARRRLIGAVALTLLAVIVLPLLLEDEPPPASSLAVHMAAADPAPRSPEPDVVAQPAPPVVAPAPPQAKPAAAADEPIKPKPVKPEPTKAEPARQPAKPQQAASTPAVTPPVKPAASETFVVQLAALSDASKASALHARATLAGLPAYTDKVGALTRVRVGPYASREAAVAAAVKLGEKGLSGQIVTQ